MELMFEKWAGAVSVLNIGATKEEGGTRAKTIQIGGEKTLPFLFAEGALPHKPVIAFEIWDVPPQDWPGEKDVLSWAEICAKDYGAELLCLRLQGSHPDFGNKSAADQAKLVVQLLKKVSLPLVILGCGDDTKDNLVLPACCEAARGERCLIGSATQDSYKTLTAAVLADGHNIIAESPIDINIAKQLNILISDMGLALERIAVNPTIGALGYGLEYAYSIMERARLAGLSGDKTLACPFICFVGQEAWRAKEAKEAGIEQGILWEAITATALIQAGADLLVMRHPKAIEKVKKYIGGLFRS
ncbi:MAG: acetyl-CoA decarbonylase/synthase complex subunit delta [Candidatus Omnitrophica bacterium]|jgi:acetyl-CoA decarbonylase/synthase complex subunit delta|nr:acetyl-CoA decarbonylase/synthase complex subunit delta [Candidatus Omnitrophota bacterium]